MKVVTILGTRPEIIRLSRVIEKLDRLCDHRVVHTGQNYDPALSDIFFNELRIRPPDEHLGIREETFGQQIAAILVATDAVLRTERPDALLLLGDTNSCLSAIIARRMGIPVFHMEAGNRCYDDRVPEEINRRIIDHCSSVLMPYTNKSKENLLREGLPPQHTYVIGNPINEVIRFYNPEISASTIRKTLGVDAGGYFLVTLHREENVDVEDRLAGFIQALDEVQTEHSRPIICSVHPRTRSKLERFGLMPGNENIHLLQPLGFFDFVSLERDAFCVLTDSGTVQEECCIFGVPTVTLRDVTERPETLECGSNMLSGASPDMIIRCVNTVLSQRGGWTPPAEYLEPDVSSKVAKIVLGFHLGQEWHN